MSRGNIEQQIKQAAETFALHIVAVLKDATLAELMQLQSTVNSQRNSPGSSHPDLPFKRRRVVLNYPKCAFPGCVRNRFVRGKGYCGEHWRMLEAGEIGPAEGFKGKTGAAKKTAPSAKKSKKG